MIPISGEEPPRAACSADEPAAVLEARQRDGELAEESRLRGNATGGTEKPKVGLRVVSTAAQESLATILLLRWESSAMVVV